MPPWALVTPASRGIGLELARRLLRTTDLPVVATARGSADETTEAILARRDGDEGGGDHAMDVEGDESRLTVLRLDVCGTRPSTPTCTTLKLYTYSYTEPTD